jgi:thioredoxin-related protein
MQKGCGYCEASVGFYKRLLNHPKKDSIQFFAVFPDESTDVENYISGLGMPTIPIRLNAFDSMGIQATPTIVVVDGKGEVTRTWRGKLSAVREAEVMSYLNLE